MVFHGNIEVGDPKNVEHGLGPQEEAQSRKSFIHLRPHVFNRRCLALLLSFLFVNSNSPIKCLFDHRDTKPSGYQSHASMSHMEKGISPGAVVKVIHKSRGWSSSAKFCSLTTWMTLILTSVFISVKKDGNNPYPPISQN